jgi:hypothetical protein
MQYHMKGSLWNSCSRQRRAVRSGAIQHLLAVVATVRKRQRRASTSGHRTRVNRRPCLRPEPHRSLVSSMPSCPIGIARDRGSCAHRGCSSQNILSHMVDSHSNSILCLPALGNRSAVSVSIYIYWNASNGQSSDTDLLTAIKTYLDKWGIHQR